DPSETGIGGQCRPDRNVTCRSGSAFGEQHSGVSGSVALVTEHKYPSVGHCQLKLPVGVTGSRRIRLDQGFSIENDPAIGVAAGDTVPAHRDDPQYEDLGGRHPGPMLTI